LPNAIGKITFNVGTAGQCAMSSELFHRTGCSRGARPADKAQKRRVVVWGEALVVLFVVFLLVRLLAGVLAVVLLVFVAGCCSSEDGAHMR
jgi:hypothetical protein